MISSTGDPVLNPATGGTVDFIVGGTVAHITLVAPQNAWKTLAKVVYQQAATGISEMVAGLEEGIIGYDLAGEGDGSETAWEGADKKEQSRPSIKESFRTVTTVRGETVEVQDAGVYRYSVRALVVGGTPWDFTRLLVGIPVLLASFGLYLRGSLRGTVIFIGSLAGKSHCSPARSSTLSGRLALCLCS